MEENKDVKKEGNPDKFVWKKGDVQIYESEKAWREAMRAQGKEIITPRK